MKNKKKSYVEIEKFDWGSLIFFIFLCIMCLIPLLNIVVILTLMELAGFFKKSQWHHKIKLEVKNK